MARIQTFRKVDSRTAAEDAAQPSTGWSRARETVQPLLRRYASAQQSHARLVVLLQLGYAAVFTGWLIYRHAWPAPDIIALFLLAFAFFAARGLSFLRDWSPFIALLFAYVALTGIAGGLVARAQIRAPIIADRFLFRGHLPTTVLQTLLWDPAQARWYDYMATLLYPMHFVVPLLLAFALWMWRKRLYWRFVGSYLLLSYGGLLTYVLYPMAPPWWAANKFQIPPVANVLDQVHFGGVDNPVDLATRFLRPNPVAAMPSLHAGFAVLVWLVLWKVWPRWGWSAVIYPAAMSFSVVYLGQHYVVDVLAGWLYALAAFGLVWGEFGGLASRLLAPARVSLRPERPRDR